MGLQPSVFMKFLFLPMVLHIVAAQLVILANATDVLKNTELCWNMMFRKQHRAKWPSMLL